MERLIPRTRFNNHPIPCIPLPNDHTQWYYVLVVDVLDVVVVLAASRCWFIVLAIIVKRLKGILIKNYIYLI